jgi:Cu/Ag efflux pump CusA
LLEEARTIQDVRALLESVPGIESEALTFLGDRIRSRSAETAAGRASSVTTSTCFDAKAKEVGCAAERTRAIDVQVPSAGSSPRIAIRPLPERLARFGLRPAEVLEQVQIAYQGAVVGQTHRGNQVTDVVVLSDPASRRRLSAVAGTDHGAQARGSRSASSPRCARRGGAMRCFTKGADAARR